MSKILVVDDYPDMLEITSIIFGAMGHDVQVASNGHEGMNLAASFDPDIVFLDLAMPVLDGFGAAAAIRSAPNGARPFIVALTAKSSMGIASATRAAGFDFFLHKPAAGAVSLTAFVTELANRTRPASPEPSRTLPC